MHLICFIVLTRMAWLVTFSEFEYIEIMGNFTFQMWNQP